MVACSNWVGNIPRIVRLFLTERIFLDVYLLANFGCVSLAPFLLRIYMGNFLENMITKMEKETKIRTKYNQDREEKGANKQKNRFRV